MWHEWVSERRGVSDLLLIPSLRKYRSLMKRLKNGTKEPCMGWTCEGCMAGDM